MSSNRCSTRSNRRLMLSSRTWTLAKSSFTPAKYRCTRDHVIKFLTVLVQLSADRAQYVEDQIHHRELCTIWPSLLPARAGEAHEIPRDVTHCLELAAGKRPLQRQARVHFRLISLRSVGVSPKPRKPGKHSLTGQVALSLTAPPRVYLRWTGDQWRLRESKKWRSGKAESR